MEINASKDRHVPTATNRQVLAFIWEFWMRRKFAFAAASILTLIWTGLDLCLPLAAAHLIGVVAAGRNETGTAWYAWRIFVTVFAGYVIIRNLTFRLWSSISAHNMEEMTNEVFQNVQAKSAEWHASSAAGETIRRVVRAMWGYDAVTDAITIRFAPAFIVLFGLSAMICFRQLVAGIIASITVIVYLIVNLHLTVRYIRPANLHSNARDAALSGMLADSLAANATVKSFSGEKREHQRIQEAVSADVKLTRPPK